MRFRDRAEDAYSCATFMYRNLSRRIVEKVVDALGSTGDVTDKLRTVETIMNVGKWQVLDVLLCEEDR